MALNDAPGERVSGPSRDAVGGAFAPAPGPPRLPRPVRILADDLTGALDTAAMFAAAVRVPVRLDRPSATDDAPVSVVSTGTRDVPPQTLSARLAPSLDWLAGAGLPFKKIDSLLRGNTLAEVAEAARGGHYDQVVFAPALPAQGRFMVGGSLRLGPPNRPEAATDADASRPLRGTFAALGLPAAIGPDAIASIGRGAGPRLLIPDILSDDTLDMLVERVLAHPIRVLWCGSAGLADAMMRRFADAAAEGCGGREPYAPYASEIPTARTRPPLLVTCSRHPALRGQLARLQTDPVAGACVLADLAPGEPLDLAAAAIRLAADAARLVAAHPRPDRIVVVGGDMLLALCRAAGVETLAAGPPPRPGWGAALLEGGAWHGVGCLSRSGAFGPPDDLVALLRDLPPPPHTLEFPPT
jgi:uncharacterized protein YgbK (DUF1537 family)